MVREQDPTVEGFNVGSNAGVAAGQTVFHCPPLSGGHRTDFECYFRYRLTAVDYRLGPHSLVLPERSAIEMR